MGISVYKIKKWYNMIIGKSIYHVNQSVGSCYSKKDIKGYYNDLREKVLNDDINILVPMYFDERGIKGYFSIGVFQYGLGAYDLYLQKHNELYKEKVIACANWALNNQEISGAWKTFHNITPNAPYSAMAQGEGASLLIRAYIITKNEIYLVSAKKAISFMLISVANAGTAMYKDNDVYLFEYTDKPLVLNGWIFALWGLYDYCKFFKDDNNAKSILNSTVNTLANNLSKFDNGYWSKYNDKAIICSPFYHKLHIAQLKVMYDLFHNKQFKLYADKWEKYEKSFLKSKLAFCVKVIQKVLE